MTEEFPFSMDTEQAARYLRMPVGKLSWLVRHGRMEVTKTCTGWMFVQTDLDRWLADQKPKP